MSLKATVETFGNAARARDHVIRKPGDPPCLANPYGTPDTFLSAWPGWPANKNIADARWVPERNDACRLYPSLAFEVLLALRTADFDTVVEPKVVLRIIEAKPEKEEDNESS